MPKRTRIKLPTAAQCLRALGLDFINAALKDWKRDAEAPEKAKVVKTKSFGTALARNLVHLVPMIALSTLIGINFQKIYIGPNFAVNGQRDSFTIALIQVGAKVIELFCIASLTTIVLHAMRHQLLGEGLPLGLLGSGIWFSSISAFWSSNFLGSFNWKRNMPKYNSRWWFYCILVVCGLIATTVAPVSAILMTPRMQNYPAGSTSFYMPGGIDDMTPSRLTSDLVLDLCAGANATEYAVCPSGGYTGVLAAVQGFRYTSFCSWLGQDYSPLCQAKGASDNRQWDNLVIQSPRGLVPTMLNSFRMRSGTDSASVMQPHATSTLIMQQVLGIWNTAASQINDYRRAQYKWTYELIARGSGVHPVVRVRCTGPQNLTSSATQALFPWLYARTSDNTSWWNDDVPSPSKDYKLANISSVNRSTTNALRAQWVALPAADFGDLTWRNMTTTGLLVELPWTGSSRAAIGCAVASTWHEIDIVSQRSSSYGAWSVALTGLDFVNSVDSPNAKRFQTPIALDQSWLDMLTIPAPSSNDNRTSTLEKLFLAVGLGGIVKDLRQLPQQVFINGACSPRMLNQNLTDTELLTDSSCGKGAWRYHVQYLMGMLVVDGISRTGSHKAFNIQPRLEDWSLKDVKAFNRTDILYGTLSDAYAAESNSLNQWVNVYVVGWAWNPNSTADYLAITGAFVYLVVALTFILYTLLRNSATSSAWETVTELLVLCQNSEPPAHGNDKLQNTSAGIDKLRTYRAIVRVRAVGPEDADGKQKIHLVVEDDASSKLSRSDSDTSAEQMEMVEPANLEHEHDEAHLISTTTPLTPVHSRAELLGPTTITHNQASARRLRQSRMEQLVVADREYV